MGTISFKIKKEPILQYSFIYLAIQYIGGRFAKALGSDAFILICLGVSVLYLLAHTSLIKKNSRYFLFLVSLFSTLMLTVIFTGGGLSFATSLALISRFLIVFVAISVNKEKFIPRFLRTCYLFAWISLILYAFVIIVGDERALSLFFSHLYEIKNDLYWLGSSYGVFLVSFNYMDATRNAYMFGEPGEYQMLMMLALYFLVFKESEMEAKTKKKYFIIFIITMLTIQSTTGLMSLIVFIFCVIFTRNKGLNKNFKRVLVIGIIAFVIYLLFFASPDSMIYRQFFNKIVNQSGNVDLATDTGADRLSAILNLVNIIRTTPSSLIFGVGYSGIVELCGGFTCSGIVNTIVMLGVFSCAILYGFLGYNILKYGKGIYEIIFILFMVINNGLSQPDLLAITTVIAACYGIIARQQRKSEATMAFAMEISQDSGMM